MGRYAAKLVRGRLRGDDVGPFKYKDKGNLATIGRGRAVAELPPGHPRLAASPRGRSGSASTSSTWSGFQNRLLVFIRWGFSFLTHGRGTRLITGEQNMP